MSNEKCYEDLNDMNDFDAVAREEYEAALVEELGPLPEVEPVDVRDLFDGDDLPF